MSLICGHFWEMRSVMIISKEVKKNDIKKEFWTNVDMLVYALKLYIIIC